MKFKEVEPLASGFIRARLSRGKPGLPRFGNVAIVEPEPDQLQVCDRSTAACVNLERDEAIALRDWLNRVLDSYPAKEGWKMVPVEPTDEMRTAARDNFHWKSMPDVWGTIYRAMLAAAPEQAAKEEG